MPAEKAMLEAEQARDQAQLAAARLSLERTTIVAPFDSRIADVAVEETQFAAQGKVLVVIDSLDVAEVTAQLPIGKLVNLMPQGAAVPIHAEGLMDALPGLLGLSAVVRLRGGDLKARWEARFTRISDTVDPQTRTIGVIVAVDDPYGKAILGVRPPLAKNMFVEVELRGPARADQVVVPRSALHDGQVYIVNADSRLERRRVGIAYLQTNFAVIGGGLAGGETIIVSDPIPAIEGMLLKSVPDRALADSLAAEARGEGPVR
jgi:RND family efflux transporter MFP subunit